MVTEDEKWDALRKTALSDHAPFCNYGRTNGRELCSCEVLVDLIEGTPDAPDLYRAADLTAAQQRMANARAAKQRKADERRRAAASQK